MFRTPRLQLLAVPVVLAVAATGCGKDDPGDSTSTGSGKKTATIEVTLTDAGCEPRSISATAGPTTFHVTNQDSSAVTEFEILAASDKILGEVENISAGLDRTLSLNLKAGSYTTKCTNGTKEFGTLEVAESGTGATADSAERIAAVTTYLTYVQAEADKLVPAATAFAAAVKAGDVTQARALFAGARYHYETIEPIAESFGDLDPRIDAREGDVDEKDWTGFHRLEQALFVTGTADGLGTIADTLVADVTELQKKIAGIELDPSQVANGAVELLNEVSSSKITGEEDRYSGTDLSDFAANLEGAKAAFDAVKPLLATDEAKLVSTIDARFTAVSAALDTYKDPSSIANGYRIYTSLKDDPAATQDLSTKVDALAEPLSRVAALVLR
ncbi:MAG: iron uptake system protein EfeO [Acidimicrobiales bacterium]